MESITIKVDSSLASEMEKVMNPGYSTKTEFIREAIREKIKQVSKEKAIQELYEQYGKAKGRLLTEQERKRILQSFFQEKGKDPDLFKVLLQK
jgi:metal-responsive CopG/Arc/MetJ family transcriptional regulator